MRKSLRALLSMPFIGFAPWILLSVVGGPGRVALAAGLACGLAVLLAVAGAVAGLRPKVLDVTAIVFFGALTVVAALADAGLRHWLGLWSAELCNAAIAVVAGVSIAARAPFTLQYARETTDREYWNTPLFLRINFVITAVWAVVFGLIAIVGFIGDGPLHEPDNIWTNWIIQIGLVVLAVKFTGWYPDHATASASHEAAHEAVPVRHRPHVGELFRPLAAYLVPVGIVVLIVGNGLWWTGAVLIVLGVVITRQVHRAAERARVLSQADAR
jgi:magnesium-transporting ATPase (P-type)